jgi:predicted dehydrogenase
VRKPRLGFLGVGWIGRNRMEAIANAGTAEIVAIAEPSPERRQSALALAPHARACDHLGQLLEMNLDGIAIATPSAMHADQAIDALERGISVFCQKPLARKGSEAKRVVETARTMNRLLAVDLSYRHTTVMRQMRELVRKGAIGKPFALDLVFHNAYGPDAAWFYDKRSAGGGCVIDLGVHLVDSALWLLDFPEVEHVDSLLYADGRPADPSQVEDYATVQMRLAGGTAVRLTCSWQISAGYDAIIRTAVYGTSGGVALENVGGSFYDFVGERYTGTKRERFASPPDDWGGRAATAWVEQLARDGSFDHSADRYVELSRVLDAIYAGANACGS